MSYNVNCIKFLRFLTNILCNITVLIASKYNMLNYQYSGVISIQIHDVDSYSVGCVKEYTVVLKFLESFHIAAFPISMTTNVSPLEKKLNFFNVQGPSKPVEILQYSDNSKIEVDRHMALKINVGVIQMTPTLIMLISMDLLSKKNLITNSATRATMIFIRLKMAKIGHLNLQSPWWQNLELKFLWKNDPCTSTYFKLK